MITKVDSTASAIKHVQENNFIVGSFDGANFSVGTSPVVHTTSVAARAECKRLANMYPGKLFIYLQLKGGELVPQAHTISI